MVVPGKGSCATGEKKHFCSKRRVLQDIDYRPLSADRQTGMTDLF